MLVLWVCTLSKVKLRILNNPIDEIFHLASYLFNATPMSSTMQEILLAIQSSTNHVTVPGLLATR